jgi:rSAM/selenodomain-associated transferase 1
VSFVVILCEEEAAICAMRTTKQGTVLVFLKNPEPGKVKTRLAAALGPERAAQLYRQWIGLVLEKLQPIRQQAKVIGFFVGGPEVYFREWHHLADDWWPQPQGDLGDRLEAGFALAHQAEGPVLAVGTDCLELDSALVCEAFAALEDHDAVFGPAADGGYYLVGTSRHLPEFFAGIRWSSMSTLEDHRLRCREQGWSAALLATRHDLDTWEDWQAYLQRQEGRNE